MPPIVPHQTIVPDPELQGYERPYHWFLPRDSIWTRIHDAYVARAVQLVVESGATKVLEVGCGDGWNCNLLHTAGLDVTGVDWSARGIALAKCLVPGAKFVVGDLRESGVRSQLRPPFDAILMVEVIEHIPLLDCAAALRTLHDYLRPDGVVVLTTPSDNWPNTNPRHFRHFTRESFESLVNESGGYSILSMEGYGDVRITRRFSRLRPIIDNRFFRVKPVLSRMLDRVERVSRGTKLAHSMGLVAVLQALNFEGGNQMETRETL